MKMYYQRVQKFGNMFLAETARTENASRERKSRLGRRMQETACFYYYSYRTT